MKNKEPICKKCKQPFVRYTTIQNKCVKCALEEVRKGKDKAHRKELREGRERLKTKSDWLREAQRAFNAYIRARDKSIGVCISCQNPCKKSNAGHYRSVGSCPELRFEEKNCHLQCEHCNTYLSGNNINYRINLVRRLGVESVEWLEGPHEPKHYTIDDIKEIRAKYTKKAKEIEND